MKKCSFQFISFKKDINFVNIVAQISETLNYHLIITINWRSVKISLKSFDINDTSKSDFKLADEIGRV